MAQPSSAHQPAGAQQQREPSMEEILASIRRIIEDSDTTKPELDTLVGNDDAPRSVPGRDSVAEMRSELASEERVPIPPVRPSLAEIHRSVRMPEPAEAPRSASVPTVDAAPVVPFRDKEKVLPRAEPVVDTSKVPPAAAVAAVPAENFVPVEKVEQVAPREADSADRGAREITTSALISGHAERQVAAAFGELSEAFAASRQRSFDEMAEEMMRPMLQEWMDNNLPLLVERLVREEIERIARGGAR